MKYRNKILYSLGLLIFLCLGTLKQAYGLQYQPLHEYSNGVNILSAFRLVKFIPQQLISIPTVVEFPLSQSEISQQPFILYESQKDKPIHYFIKTIYGKQPVTISTNGAFDTDITKLHDNNTDTFFESVSDGIEKTTTLYYKSAAPVRTSQLRITLSANAFEPKDVSILALNRDAGIWKNVAVHVSYSSGYISFPEEEASEWQIIFNHAQSLRIAEAEFISNTPSQPTYNAIRFLAEPGGIYYLYLSADRSVQIPYAEYTNLDDPIDSIVRIETPISINSSFYSKADIDADTITDDIDNCPNTVNTDQKDVNNNRIGDACEDFDRDGVMNNRDNCPNNPNMSQTDADSDGYGDVCDPEESRLTERIWWLPWLGIVVGFGTVIAIFSTTARSHKKQTAS